jgi:hypothetical protein
MGVNGRNVIAAAGAEGAQYTAEQATAEALAAVQLEPVAYESRNDCSPLGGL